MTMSSLMRSNPNRRVMSMAEAIDRLFDDAFVMSGNGGFGAAGPKVDVTENDDNIVVKADLPGFNPDNVDIRVEGNLLTLHGEYSEEKEEQKEGQYHVRERRQGTFHRTIPLPTDVDADKAKAQFDNGVLNLTLPKHENAKPKRINITAKSSK
jgi:HSP20 family protein